MYTPITLLNNKRSKILPYLFKKVAPRDTDVKLTPSLGMGSGANIHSPNEYMNFEDFQKTMDTAIHVYYTVAETMV